jgi:hypothetical protein
VRVTTALQPRPGVAGGGGGRGQVPAPATLGEVYQRNQRLDRGFLLYHQLPLLYDLNDPALAPAHLGAWSVGPRAAALHRSSRPPAPCAATANVTVSAEPSAPHPDAIACT